MNTLTDKELRDGLNDAVRLLICEEYHDEPSGPYDSMQVAIGRIILPDGRDAEVQLIIETRLENYQGV